MEFSLYGIKFNYEYGNVYRLYHLKKGDEWKERKIQRDTNGYKRFQFMINKKIYSFSLHRIVYWLHNPEWDIMDSNRNNAIDHIDGDRQNNNIENLRLVTQQENNWNQTRSKGYSWNKGRWQSQIKVNNKTICLGRFDNEEDAHNCYLDAKKKYHIIR